MGQNAASCLKLGLGDEIDSVKETKIVLSFSVLDYETASTRCGAPNPANRQDFPSPGRSFAPTNDPRRPAGQEHEISQQSEQVIPRTDIPSPGHRSQQRSIHRRALTRAPSHRARPASYTRRT